MDRNKIDKAKEELNTDLESIAQNLESYNNGDVTEPDENLIRSAKLKLKQFDEIRNHTSDDEEGIEEIAPFIWTIKDILTEKGHIVGSDEYDDRVDEISDKLHQISNDLYFISIGEEPSEEAELVFKKAREKEILYYKLIADLDDNEGWIEELKSLCERNILKNNKYLS